MNDDLIMERSVSQAMYRYLPGRWVDFYIKNTRTSYTAFVEHWNSTPIEGVNVGRIKRQVWHRLAAAEGKTRNFAPLNDDSAWQVLTPKVNDKNSSISVSVSPILFSCSNPKCKRARQFRTSSDYLRNSKNNTCSCGSLMTQVRMIYYCRCGWAAPVEWKLCKNGCRGTFTRISTYAFMCDECGEIQELERFCPECNQFLRPRNALDNAQFYPQSFHLIDLVDVEKEKYVTSNRDGALVALATYFGYLNKEEFENVIKTNALGGKLGNKEEAIEKNYSILKSNPAMACMPDDVIRQIARQMYETNNPLSNVEGASQQVEEYVILDDVLLQKAAVAYLEYDTVISVSENRDLDAAAKIAVKLEEAENEESYKKTAHALHFSQIKACDNVPFVSVVYGYTRYSTDVESDHSVNIRAFSRENGLRSNIYATKMETEGILFEFDRHAIMRWLLKNNVITSIEYTEDMDEVDLKAWFLNHCSHEIPVFGNIDGQNEKQKWVYTLLHSISHALIRHAEAYTGLDKNSLAEYIFPEIPAIFIYCQNVQGFDLGAMFSAMESKLDNWLKTVRNELNQCIFDPMCINDKGACSGCLYLGDVTCCHFNHDLDRRLLIGYKDVANQNRIYGFWEE